MDENNFKSFFNKKETDTDFKSIYDFESHYNDYFKESKYITDKSKYKFKLYDLKKINRKEFIDNLKYITYTNNPYLFYGNPGMGKSITLIYTLKYAYNHDTTGSFYIHCKFLYNAFQCNYENVKNILKDEIVYLFKNEYN